MATSKKPAKVMDTVRSGDTPPNPSSRPVLVTNRPFMAVDPMLTVGETTASGEKPSGEPVPKLSDNPTGAPRLTREGKNIAPVSNQGNEANENPAAKDSTAQETTQDDQPEPEKPEPDQPETDAPETEQPVHRTGGIKITPPKHGTSGDQDAPDELSETEPGSTEEVSAESSEEDPEAARNLEIERHIAAGTYFVPIGQVKRRRRKIVIITVLVLLVAVVGLDLLLDMEILKLDSIPHTSLFT